MSGGLLTKLWDDLSLWAIWQNTDRMAWLFGITSAGCFFAADAYGDWGIVLSAIAGTIPNFVLLARDPDHSDQHQNEWNAFASWLPCGLNALGMHHMATQLNFGPVFACMLAGLGAFWGYYLPNVNSDGHTKVYEDRTYWMQVAMGLFMIFV